MWRRKKTGVAAVAAGAVLFAAGLADYAFAAPKAALCQSGIGQFVQDLDGSVAHDCGLVTALEAATGWLLVAGVLIAVFGAAVIFSARAAVTRPAWPVLGSSGRARRRGVLVEPDLNLALAAVARP